MLYVQIQIAFVGEIEGLEDGLGGEFIGGEAAYFLFEFFYLDEERGTLAEMVMRRVSMEAIFWLRSALWSWRGGAGLRVLFIINRLSIQNIK